MQQIEIADIDKEWAGGHMFSSGRNLPQTAVLDSAADLIDGNSILYMQWFTVPQVFVHIYMPAWIVVRTCLVLDSL